MSERASLVAEPREITGKKSKQLRVQGWIPGVIYGRGKESSHIKVENLPLRRVLRDVGKTRLIDVSIGEVRRTVLAKEIQQHPTRGDLIHVDFYEVDMKEKLIVKASLIASGIAAPVVEGIGTTSLVIHSVEVECLPESLVSEINVDLTLIATSDDVIIVKDLVVPEGVEILADPHSIVARFDFIQLEIEEEESEEDLLFGDVPDEVEVITKSKEEDDEDSES